MKLFGDELRFIGVGSAPISANVLNILRNATGAVIIEGYGQ